MEYQKIINLLDNPSNQLSKFRTKNSFEKNNDSHETKNSGSQIRSKTSMLKSSLRDYSDAYIREEELTQQQDKETKKIKK